MPVASSFPSIGSSTRVQQGYMNAPGQADDGFPAYSLSNPTYPSSYGDGQMASGGYKSSDTYNVWSTDGLGQRNQSVSDNLRRASYTNPRYFPSSPNAALGSAHPSAFPSMAHLGTMLPMPRLPSSRPRHSIGSNMQLRSNGMEIGTNSIDLSQLQPGANSRAGTSFPWLDDPLSTNYPSPAHTASTSLSTSNAASHTPLSTGLAQDAPILPHRSSYDFNSQLYSRNPSLSQGVDAAESLTSLGQYNLSRTAPQPTRSPSDHSSDDSTSYGNNGSRNYTFLPNFQGITAAQQPTVGSMPAPYPTQEPATNSLQPRTLSTCSTSDTQATSIQSFTTSHDLSRRASTRQLVGDTNGHNLSDSSTDSSGK